MAAMAPEATMPLERATVGGSLEIPRIINGLWQLAGGHDKDVKIANASAAMDTFISSGLEAFDVADHYGDAELVIGNHNAHEQSKGQEHLSSLFSTTDHIWDYTDDTYIHNLTHLTSLQSQGRIAHLGLTNTDAAHLEMLLDTGFNIETNQVSCSVIDLRPVRGRMSRLCASRDVGLLCYGTLLGGFVSEKWLGQPEPADIDTLNWSLRKYLRFIWAAGGWADFQVVLAALDTVAKKHGVSIPAVATRWVLDLPAVKAVIVGTRLSAHSEKHIAENLLAFSVTLDDEDRAVIAKAQEGLRDIPGDCGDEYRRPPYLTAAGDLSHHVKETDRARSVREAIAAGQRVEYLSGNKWEPICGYSRAVRVGSHIHISGTTANPPVPSLSCVGGRSAKSQAVWALDIIEGALKALGSSMKDVVRTRVILSNRKDAEAVSEAHGWRMHCVDVLPANTLIEATLYEDEFLVEIEAWAEVDSGARGTVPD
ncbi:endoribonuclease L-PSP [Diaporthe helianthi]|uniref:Endoribonuclease L-PSP n=1 Tax=Diaporthe helianthi TaxID=158607 RepID=A0A2P5I842_DIAHE|nr:endoribonuclease L-PSP [Diaporthe helianthi]